MSYKKPLIITLWLIALHSFGVGIGMIFLPSEWIAYFNIVPSEHRFFITQGGVFHILMAVAYLMATLDIKTNSILIRFSIIVKISATVFLFGYFFFINQYFIILFSGLADFIMGLALILLFNKYKIELNE